MNRLPKFGEKVHRVVIIEGDYCQPNTTEYRNGIVQKVIVTIRRESGDLEDEYLENVKLGWKKKGKV
jgi:hypothetical protein